MPRRRRNPRNITTYALLLRKMAFGPNASKGWSKRSWDFVCVAWWLFGRARVGIKSTLWHTSAFKMPLMCLGQVTQHFTATVQVFCLDRLVVAQIHFVAIHVLVRVPGHHHRVRILDAQVPSDRALFNLSRPEQFCRNFAIIADKPSKLNHNNSSTNYRLLMAHALCLMA